MTTNHRPTLESKRGRAHDIKDSIQHARALPQQTKVKLRSDIPDTEVDSRQAKRGVDELKQELLAREAELNGSNKRIRLDEVAESAGSESDEDSEDEEALLLELSRVRQEAENDEDLTNVVPVSSEKPEFKGEASGSDEDQDSNSSESEDETEMLLAELNKIKQERKAKEEAEKIEQARTSNPLINLGGSGEPKPKKSWRNNTTFNSKPGASKDQKFTNDTLKSEQHQKFLSKYIR